MNRDECIDLLKREASLWKQRTVLESARCIAIREDDPDPYGLASFMLRDLPFTEEAELKDLAWSMCKSGYIHESDWEYLREEWQDAWFEAIDELEKRKEELCGS